MTYNADMQAAVEDQYSHFAVPALYTKNSGAESYVSVILEHDLSRFGDGELEIAVGTVGISVRKSEVALIPIHGETFVIDGSTYTVQSSVTSDELEHTVLAA